MAATPALNALDRDAFVARFGPVFESSPWVAEAAWERRPFAGAADLHAAMVAAVDEAPLEKQLALIRAHPDLAGKAAIAGTLTAHSRDEQASAGLDRLTPEEHATFTRLNTAYRERFGFPFVICVREHTKDLDRTIRVLAQVTGLEEKVVREVVDKHRREPSYRPIVVIEP